MSLNLDGGHGPLEFFGANAEDIDIGPERKRGVSREVCVCGHPMAHHESVYEGLDSCQESKMFCPCRFKKAVLEVEDLRAFKFSSEGYGRDHALWKGLKKLRTMGKGATALVDSTCWKCLEKRPIEPVSITPGNLVSRQPQARNVMVCIPCRYVLEGIDPSFIVSEEAAAEISFDSKTGEDVSDGNELPTAGDGPAWPHAFKPNPGEELVGNEGEDEPETESPLTKSVGFQKLTEAPY